MKYFNTTTTTPKTPLSSFEYVKLNQDNTQTFIKAIARLFDSVYETTDNDFINYVSSNSSLSDNDPAELFARVFKAVDSAEETSTKYQKQFYNFAQVNINTIFKWYRKNAGCVNISPKQLEWFKRWFAKHNIGHEVLLNTQLDYTRSITPNFKELFE